MNLNELDALTERKAFNIITRMIGDAANKQRIIDIGQKNEDTKKIGQRVHEFEIGDMVFQVIRVL